MRHYKMMVIMMLMIMTMCICCGFGRKVKLRSSISKFFCFDGCVRIGLHEQFIVRFMSVYMENLKTNKRNWLVHQLYRGWKDENCESLMWTATLEHMWNDPSSCQNMVTAIRFSLFDFGTDQFFGIRQMQRV